MKLLLGLFLILFVSPFILWFGESADLAGDFKKATVVEDVNTIVSDYVRLEGPVSLPSALSCPKGSDDCLYVSSKTEVYQLLESIQCGEVGAEVTILERVDDSCDDAGYNCEACYRVEGLTWVTTDESEEFASFNIGAYNVTPNASTLFVQEQTFIDEDLQDAALKTEGDTRTTYHYFPVTGPLTALGNASASGAITGAEKTFVVSSLGAEGTFDALKQMDRNTRFAGRIFSALMMMLGFVLLVAQFVDPVAGVFRAIPFIGGLIHKGARGIIYVIAALIGLVFWIPVFIVMWLFNNLWIAILVAVILAGIFVYLEVKAKKKPLDKVKSFTRNLTKKK